MSSPATGLYHSLLKKLSHSSSPPADNQLQFEKAKQNFQRWNLAVRNIRDQLQGYCEQQAAEFRHAQVMSKEIEKVIQEPGIVHQYSEMVGDAVSVHTQLMAVEQQQHMQVITTDALSALNTILASNRLMEERAVTRDKLWSELCYYEDKVETLCKKREQTLAGTEVEKESVSQRYARNVEKLQAAQTRFDVENAGLTKEFEEAWYNRVRVLGSMLEAFIQNEILFSVQCATLLKRIRLMNPNVAAYPTHAPALSPVTVPNTAQSEPPVVIELESLTSSSAIEPSTTLQPAFDKLNTAPLNDATSPVITPAVIMTVMSAASSSDFNRAGANSNQGERMSSVKSEALSCSPLNGSEAQARLNAIDLIPHTVQDSDTLDGGSLIPMVPTHYDFQRRVNIDHLSLYPVEHTSHDNDQTQKTDHHVTFNLYGKEGVDHYPIDEPKKDELGNVGY